MQALRKLVVAVYAVACVVVIGGGALMLYGPYRTRMVELIEQPSARAVGLVCLVIMALQALIAVIRRLSERPEPECIHPGGNPDIEVSVTALESLARAAAPEELVLIERVRGRIRGRANDSVQLDIEAIALTDHGLESMAHRMQQRVVDACERLLGTTGVTARVRFLPSKTVSVTKEVSS